MFSRLVSAASLVALLGATAFSAPAQAGGVSWSVGINAPIAPGVHVGTVIGGGHHHHRHHVPAPVVYAPPPVYFAPPPVYVPAPVVYAPRPIYVAPRPVVYRAPIVVRPGYRHHHHHHHHRGDNRGDINWPQGQPSRGGYGPVAMGR